MITSGDGMGLNPKPSLAMALRSSIINCNLYIKHF